MKEDARNWNWELRLSQLRETGQPKGAQKMKSRRNMTWMCGLVCGVVTLATVASMHGAALAQPAVSDRDAALVPNATATPKPSGPEFTDEFFDEDCHFATTGRNRFFVLEPGYQIILEGQEDGEKVQKTITVLNQTKKIKLGDREIITRVVEERETKDCELYEVSRNYFARCRQTNDIFYFGEAVKFYEDGEVVGTDGSWEAGVNGAQPGIIMPGTILLGARYYQEVAPGVAEDRAEIISMNEVVQTPAGRFQNCLKTKETTPLEPGLVEFKFYAPGIGLIQDGPLKLVSRG